MCTGRDGNILFRRHTWFFLFTRQKKLPIHIPIEEEEACRVHENAIFAGFFNLLPIWKILLKGIIFLMIHIFDFLRI